MTISFYISRSVSSAGFLMWALRRESSSVAASRDDASPWPTALVVWRPGADYHRRSHYSAQVIFPFRDSLRARLGSEAMWTRCAAVFAAPRTSFEIDSDAAPLVMGFVDPDSDVTSVPDPPHGPRVAAIPEGVVERWRRALGAPETLDGCRLDAWVRSELVSASHHRSIHPGVRRVVYHVRRHGLERHATSLACLAQVAQMSQSRLMHVFTESLGIPLRPYLAWLRVQHALAALVLRHTVTEAAHIAGFADAPHLTRTVRRTVGVTPRQLIPPPYRRVERYVPAPSPRLLDLP
jgi:AraC-like DNA-binding protein